MQRPPIHFIVKIGDRYLQELIYYWIYYDKPCVLTLQEPKETPDVTAVRLTVDSDRTADFLHRVMEKTGCRLYKV